MSNRELEYSSISVLEDEFFSAQEQGDTALLTRIRDILQKRRKSPRVRALLSTVLEEIRAGEVIGQVDTDRRVAGRGERGKRRSRPDSPPWLNLNWEACNQVALVTEQDFLEVARRLVENAKEIVWYSTYKINSKSASVKPFVEALSKKASSVPVTCFLGSFQEMGKMFYRVTNVNAAAARLLHEHSDEDAMLAVAKMRVHAKVLQVDDRYTLIGSANTVDAESSLFELCVLVDSEPFAESVSEWFNELVMEAIEEHDEQAFF